MIGPILILKIRGYFCKCLESDDDRMIREAVIELTNLPVLWHDHEPRSHTDTNTSVKDSNLALDPQETEADNPDSTSRVGKFASQLWNSVSRNKFLFGSSSKTRKSISAILSIVDSEKGPALCVQQQDAIDSQRETDTSDSNTEDELTETRHPKKLIPLKKIKKVTEYNTFLTTRSSGIIVHGQKKQEDSDDSDHDNMELLRIDIRSSKHTVLLATSDRRDEIIQYLLTVVRWDQTRRAKSGSDNDGTDNEDGDSDDELDDHRIRDEINNVASSEKVKLGPISESEKIKRHEDREIELLQKKREREQRKARYLKEAGGLKYTAIAMANRA